MEGAEVKPEAGGAVKPGEIVAWVEGFKAASDVYCVMDSAFEAGNPYLQQDACIVRTDPYEVGWLYSVRGEPEAESLDVHGYIELLDATIQRMAAKGHGDDDLEDGAA